MTTVLLVGDELRMSRALRAGLLTLACRLLAAPDGASGLEMAARHVPDLVVLDLDLPDMVGIDVIAGLRTWSKVPIIALRDADAAPDIIEVLDAGADDCVTAPFDPDVLMARVRALRRRARDAAPVAEQSVLIGHHSLDLGEDRDQARRCARRRSRTGASDQDRVGDPRGPCTQPGDRRHRQATDGPRLGPLPPPEDGPPALPHRETARQARAGAFAPPPDAHRTRPRLPLPP